MCISHIVLRLRIYSQTMWPQVLVRDCFILEPMGNMKKKYWMKTADPNVAESL